MAWERAASLRRAVRKSANVRLLERPEARAASASAARPASRVSSAGPRRGLDKYGRAAAALLDADVLLIAAGAGMSADSGLAVYKDIASVPAWRKAGLTYADLCDPCWLEDDPEIFYGFWGSCLNTYMETAPHDGYGIMRRWIADHFSKDRKKKQGGNISPTGSRGGGDSEGSEEEEASSGSDDDDDESEEEDATNGKNAHTRARTHTHKAIESII